MLQSILTNDGLGQSIVAQANEGFFIKIKEFAVSETKGDLIATRTSESSTPWYTGLISAGYFIDDNTCEVVMTVPADADTVNRDVKEIYLYADDNAGGSFLLAIGQPDPEQLFSPGGALTFRLQVRVQNVNVGALYQFIYTQATEISEHNADVNAHPYLTDRLNKHGIYEQEVNRKWVGQHIEQFTRSSNMNTLVDDKDIVYWDDDVSEYNRAIVDGTDRENPVGIYIGETQTIAYGGVVGYTHTYDPYTNLYLSSAVDGGITDVYSKIMIGFALPNNKIFLNIKNLIKYGAVVGGGGGSGSFLPIMGDISPYEDLENGVEFLGYSDNNQEVFFNFKIPEGYVSGNQLVLAGGVFYCENATTGDLLMKCETALLKKGSHIFDIFTDIHNSTNSAVSAPLTVKEQCVIGNIDLTNSNGEINGQVVEEGDILRIRLYRDTDNEAISISDTVLIPKHSFEPKKVLS